ncbi:DUF6325 family protein [Hamadaea tsunoensis]|uniref:DUF6325 family protein n=1 Tax=Hamadaea tsunoensis TaxID=53368 RepID=UPI0003F5BEC0|nr:DUF6325 family protein [Hamadaea tsunoensis]
MKHGAVEFVVIDFPGEVPTDQLAPEMKRLVDGGIINLVDALFVRRTHDDDILTFELGQLPESMSSNHLNQLVQSIDGMIGDEDVDDVAADLEPGHTAAILIFEHAWLRGMREALSRAGGEVVLVERIPGPVVDAVLATR